MKVLITFALANEFAGWRKLRRFRLVSTGEWAKTYVAQAGLCDLRVVLTGAGRFATERALRGAFESEPDVCIASGLSGSLKLAYAPGGVLAARTVTDVNGTRLVRCDQELVARAQESGARAVETFLVSDDVISTTQQKCALAASGDAVDMESMYVLAAAAERGIRSIAIRAISDGADSDLPIDFSRVFDERGAVSVPKVIGQAVRRPGRLPGLIRLAHDSSGAASSLARFLEAYVQAIASRPLPEIAKAEALAV
jgi:adenosylhomocysteine nucleosidase